MNLFYTFYSDYDALPECPLSIYRRTKTKQISDPNLLRKQYITEFFLLKCLLSVDNEIARPLNIITTQNGKPYIPGWKYHFSISHSEDLLVIAVDDKEIGVDCQFINNNIDFLKISERYFSEKEILNIKDINDFYELWTKKEAYSKKHDMLLMTGLKEDVSSTKFSHTVFKGYHISVCQE